MFDVRLGLNGFGLVATQDILSGTKIFKISGDILGRAEVALLDDDSEARCVQVGPALFIGPTGDSHDFLNHSCNPNAKILFENDDSIWVAAIQDINSGVEITIDYSTTMFKDEWTMNCNCGFEGCRNVIVEFLKLPENFSRALIERGMVAPYILESR
jgi:hypothetical protein